MSGRAEFVHWQESPYEDIPSEPMFNVIINDQGRPNGSTVTGHTLLTVYKIALPLFPDLQTWQARTRQKQRCRYCWACTRGPADYARHLQIVHCQRCV